MMLLRPSYHRSEGPDGPRKPKVTQLLETQSVA